MKNTVTKQLTFPKKMVEVMNARAEELGYNFAGYIRYLLAREMEREFYRDREIDAEILKDLSNSFAAYKRGETETLKSKEDIDKFVDSLSKDVE
jgi:hypothetical protein